MKKARLPLLIGLSTPQSERSLANVEDRDGLQGSAANESGKWFWRGDEPSRIAEGRTPLVSRWRQFSKFRVAWQCQMDCSALLFCGDAGFVGYEFWSTLQQRGHHFLMRVGANVRLPKKMGSVRQQGDLVHFWPHDAARKKLPPIALRLLAFSGGRSRVYVVPNVLDEKQLSLNEASKLYRLRWGIELQFRALKQTFGRDKLRGRTPENADLEL